jgi:hypothetical protein
MLSKKKSLKSVYINKNQGIKMNQETIENIPAFYFLSEQNYKLGTPGSISKSDRTIDIPFHDLAKSYDIQDKLGLLTKVYIKPFVHKVFVEPLSDSEIIDSTASFLSAFEENLEIRKQKRDYLVNNRLIRILVKSPELYDELKKVL